MLSITITSTEDTHRLEKIEIPSPTEYYALEDEFSEILNNAPTLGSPELLRAEALAEALDNFNFKDMKLGPTEF